MNLEDLLITESEIERVIQIGILRKIALDFYCFWFKRQKQLFFSILLTEVFLVILVLVFVLPINILLLRNISSDFYILQVTLGVTCIIVSIVNIYFYFLGKKNETLGNLINKIESYNHIVKTMMIGQKIAIMQKGNTGINQEILAIMRNIKENLINALQITQIVQPYQNIQLFMQLENNLTNLISFETNKQEGEYQELLQDAVDIALSLHKEIRTMNRD